MLVNYKANCFASNLKKLSFGFMSLTKMVKSGMWFLLVNGKENMFLQNPLTNDKV
jgi:hypothetical protein